MKTIARLACCSCFVSLAVLLQGCAFATYAQKPMKDMTKTLASKYSESSNDKGFVWLEKFNEQVKEANELVRAGQGPDADIRKAELRVRRNAILGELIVLAEQVHDQVNARLHYGRAWVNSTLDATQIVSTAIASVSKTEAAAKNLAALATGTKGIQESVDMRFFYQQATSALITEMNIDRTKAKTELIAQYSKSIDEWPMENALADWGTFFLAGNVADALSRLGTEAKVRELKALETLNALNRMADANAQKLAEIEAAQAAEEVANAEAEEDRLVAIVRTSIFVDSATQTRVDALLDRLATLSGDEALSLMKQAPPPSPELEKLVALTDPKNARFSDPAVARKILNMILVMGRRSDSELEVMETALTALGR